MRFSTDDEDLSITLELTDEPEGLDLTDGLGDELLDAAVRELLRCYGEERAPSGAWWDHLAASTVREKGHDRIGVRTGQMLQPGNIYAAPRDITPRSCTWTFPQPDGRKRKEHGFHNGNPRNRQPARPLVGWTAEAKEQIHRLVAEATFPNGPDAFGGNDT